MENIENYERKPNVPVIIKDQKGEEYFKTYAENLIDDKKLNSVNKQSLEQLAFVEQEILLMQARIHFSEYNPDMIQNFVELLKICRNLKRDLGLN